MHQQRPLLENPYDESWHDMLKAETNNRVIATHMPPPLLPRDIFKGRVIYVYRNPKDVCCSLYCHNQNQITWPFDIPFEQWVEVFMRGETTFGPFHKHLKAALEMKKEGKPVLFLSYEEMKLDTKKTLMKLADFLQVDLANDERLMAKILEAISVEKMRNNNDANGAIWRSAGTWKNGSNFVRKGKVGNWKEFFTDCPDLLVEFDKFIEENYPKEMLSTMIK